MNNDTIRDYGMLQVNARDQPLATRVNGPIMVKMLHATLMQEQHLAVSFHQRSQYLPQQQPPLYVIAPLMEVSQVTQM